MYENNILSHLKRLQTKTFLLVRNVQSSTSYVSLIDDDEGINPVSKIPTTDWIIESDPILLCLPSLPRGTRNKERDE